MKIAKPASRSSGRIWCNSKADGTVRTGEGERFAILDLRLRIYDQVACEYLIVNLAPLQKGVFSPQRRQERKDFKIFKKNIKNVVENVIRYQIFSLNLYFLSGLCVFAV